MFYHLQGDFALSRRKTQRKCFKKDFKWIFKLKSLSPYDLSSFQFQFLYREMKLKIFKEDFFFHHSFLNGAQRDISTPVIGHAQVDNWSDGSCSPVSWSQCNLISSETWIPHVHIGKFPDVLSKCQRKESEHPDR